VRIAIDTSAANDPDAHQWLDRILYRIEDGWHVWDWTGVRGRVVKLSLRQGQRDSLCK